MAAIPCQTITANHACKDLQWCATLSMHWMMLMILWRPLIDTCHTACCMCRLNLNHVGHSSLQLQHVHFQDENPPQRSTTYMARVHKCMVIIAWHALEWQDVLEPNFSSFKEVNDQLAGLSSKLAPAKAYQLSGLMSSQDQVSVALQASTILLACMHVQISVLGLNSEGSSMIMVITATFLITTRTLTMIKQL